MLYSGIDSYLAIPRRGLFVTAGGSLVEAWSSGFLAIHRYGQQGPPVLHTAVDDHPTIPHARANGITTSVLQNRWRNIVFATSLGPDLVVVLYIELPFISNHIPCLMPFGNTHFKQHPLPHHYGLLFNAIPCRLDKKIIKAMAWHPPDSVTVNDIVRLKIPHCQHHHAVITCRQSTSGIMTALQYAETSPGTRTMRWPQ